MPNVIFKSSLKSLTTIICHSFHMRFNRDADARVYVRPKADSTKKYSDKKWPEMFTIIFHYSFITWQLQ